MLPAECSNGFLLRHGIIVMSMATHRKYRDTMFSLSFKLRQKAGGTSKPQGAGNVTSKGGNVTPKAGSVSPKTGNVTPKAEVGEVDTRAPFQSVKAAVSLFGEVAVSKEKKVVKRQRAASTECVLGKETQLVFAQNELGKLKEHLKSSETLKGRTLIDLEKANRTVRELENKLNLVCESKQAAWQMTETMNNKADQLEAALSGHSERNKDWKKDLDQARELYKGIFAELGSAKKELRKVRQDFDAVLESKMRAFEQAADAHYNAKVNSDRASVLSKEISAVQESCNRVQLASEGSLGDHQRNPVDNDSEWLSTKAELEEAQKKLVVLRKEFDLEAALILMETLAKTNTEIEALREVKEAQKLCADAMKFVTMELADATKNLQQLAEEESSLQNEVEFLRTELDNVKTECSDYSDREAGMRSHAENLNARLQEAKAEYESCQMEAMKATHSCDEMARSLVQLTSETEKQRKEAQKLSKKAEEIQREAQTSRMQTEELDKRIELAVQEANNAKAAQTAAYGEMSSISDKTHPARDPESETTVKLSVEDFKSLSQKPQEIENLVEVKLANAKSQFEKIIMAKSEVDEKLVTNLKMIEEINAATADAIKQAEMAEAAKRAVETELRKWRQHETEPSEIDAPLVVL